MQGVENIICDKCGEVVGRKFGSKIYMFSDHKPWNSDLKKKDDGVLCRNLKRN